MTSSDHICMICGEEISDDDWETRHSIEDREAHEKCCEERGICSWFFSKPGKKQDD